MPPPSTSSPKSNPLISALCQRMYAAAVTDYQFQQEASFIRAIRDSTPDLLLELRADGTVLNIKRAPEFNLFRATAEVLQHNIAELLPAAAARDLQRALDDALREQRLTRCEWTLSIDEQEQHFEVRVACLRSDRVLAIVRDMTAERLALDQVREFPRQLLDAQEQERRRLASDLHDEIGQDLTAIILTVAHAQPGATPAAQRDLEEAETMLRALVNKIRHLAQDLHPSTLTDFGLTEALSELMGRFTRQTTLRVEYQLPEPALRLPPEVELPAYRIVQEALTNVARHAAAQWVTVTVKAQAPRLLIQVVDDGQGFDATTISWTEVWGLNSIRERARLLGGTFKLKTTPGGGTRVEVELPLSGLPTAEEII